MILNQVTDSLLESSALIENEDNMTDPFEFLVETYYETALAERAIYLSVTCEEYNYLRETGLELTVVTEAGIVGKIFQALKNMIQKAFESICSFFKAIFGKSKNSVSEIKQNNAKIEAEKEKRKAKPVSSNRNTPEQDRFEKEKREQEQRLARKPLKSPFNLIITSNKEIMDAAQKTYESFNRAINNQTRGSQGLNAVYKTIIRVASGNALETPGYEKDSASIMNDLDSRNRNNLNILKEELQKCSIKEEDLDNGTYDRYGYYKVLNNTETLNTWGDVEKWKYKLDSDIDNELKSIQVLFNNAKTNIDICKETVSDLEKSAKTLESQLSAVLKRNAGAPNNIDKIVKKYFDQLNSLSVKFITVFIQSNTVLSNYYTKRLVQRLESKKAFSDLDYKIFIELMLDSNEPFYL